MAVVSHDTEGGMGHRAAVEDPYVSTQEVEGTLHRDSRLVVGLAFNIAITFKLVREDTKWWERKW